MRDQTEYTVYDKETYTTVAGLFQLLKVLFLLWSIIGGAFLMLVFLVASSSRTIPNGLFIFYLILSFGASVGALIFFAVLEHPNKWVRRAFLFIFATIPPLIMFSL